MTTLLRKPSALLLAADREARLSLADALRARGFDVLAAGDGTEGVALLLEAILELDVLVTDLELPGRDGASLVHLVRAGGERDLPVVVRAGGLSRGDRAALLALGADAVISPATGAAATAAAAARLAAGAPPALLAA